LGVTLTQYVQFTDELFLGLSFVFHLCTLQIKNQGPKDRLKAQGTGHKEKQKRKLILSLCLAPYALCLKPLLPAKPFNTDLALRTGFSMLNKVYFQDVSWTSVRIGLVGLASLPTFPIG
jgi:hypothetical protein